MSPLTESDRRLLTEYLGECWHEWKGPSSNFCSKCDKYAERNRTFITIQDFYDLKVKIVERGEWEDFIEFAYRGVWDRICGRDTKGEFTNWLINPDRCETVASWLRGRKER
jgi:hypothetical protein